MEDVFLLYIHEYGLGTATSNLRFGPFVAWMWSSEYSWNKTTVHDVVYKMLPFLNCWIYDSSGRRSSEEMQILPFRFEYCDISRKKPNYSSFPQQKPRDLWPMNSSHVTFHQPMLALMKFCLCEIILAEGGNTLSPLRHRLIWTQADELMVWKRC